MSGQIIKLTWKRIMLIMVCYNSVSSLLSNVFYLVTYTYNISNIPLDLSHVNDPLEWCQKYAPDYVADENYYASILKAVPGETGYK